MRYSWTLRLEGRHVLEAPWQRLSDPSASHQLPGRYGRLLRETGRVDLHELLTDPSSNDLSS